MLKEDKFYKGYKKIAKGLEGYGYTDWKEKVIAEIEQDKNIENIKKRVEIKRNQHQISQKRSSIFECVAQYILLGTALITLIWNYADVIIETLQNLYKDNVSESFLAEQINEFSGYSLIQCVTIIVGLICLICIGQICDICSESRHTMKVNYYNDILKVIGEIEEK